MEIYLSFVIGTLLTLLVVYAERAYSESFPKQTKTIEDVKRETIAVFCKMKTPQARLEVLSETLEFKREILHTIFEPDNPDLFSWIMI
ncbi:hypothetical protein [Leptospira kirschneri]|uniref:hypothetical protein n=1 Tax=Leptospira kirschneri TaxID=29507 RepID=UPI0020CA108F|nr:hypothetical protein [Leptospira kirschneri]